jgi:hypothetical protein
MAVFIGFKATMMKVLIHAPGDGFQVMRLLALCSFDIARTEQANKKAPAFTRAFL